MTLEHFRSEELPKLNVNGRAPSGAIHVAPPAPRRVTFLLEPGGQDYVGNNSYDEAS